MPGARRGAAKERLANVLAVAPDKLRVLSYDVGGNFGTRNRVFVEFVSCCGPPASYGAR